ncbi:ABC transporter ATP-binding protein [Synechococcus lacustris C3-12m-Tous]|nr:ABC transporter ATP-binding protein [Synechococcus lacustris]MCP9925817.1 ABC transporter ATP-binding protein [Synechococcus lacustris C3-12m-Tous]
MAWLRKRSQTIDQLSRLISYLPQERRKALWQILPISVLPGLLDLALVAVGARLVGALVGNNLEDKLPGVRVFGGKPLDQTLWLIALFIGLAWFASFSKLFLQLVQQKLTARIWRDLSNEIHARVLRQKYDYHLTRSTAELTTSILSNIRQSASGVINPTLRIFSALVSILLLSFGILWIGRFPAFLLLITVVLAYLGLSTFVTPYLRHARQQNLRLEVRSTHLLLESLASVRDITLTGTEAHFQKSFSVAGERARRYAWMSAMLPIVPRLLIEPLGITLIFVIGAVPALMQGEPQKVLGILPFLSALAIAAQRLTPPLQDLFHSLTELRGGLPQVSHTVDLLELPVERLTLGCPGVPSPAGIYPQHSIRLRDAWYRYPNTEEWVLKGVNLTIPLGSRIALVGSTGSGKTTTAHLLLALLQPELGSFELDGNPLTAEEVPAWQANCAQVPQFIQLLDASVRDNVAFGIDNNRIDDDRVWEALEAAQLEEYVADLPFGLLTQVGENGHQLSGGQRQRLALARAFYRNSGFLVLDEATSSLDNRTENEVINALEVVGRRCTTVVIAHRLSTIARCDRIYEFEKGVVKASGSFDELRQRSASFQELASLERFSSIN